MSKRLKERSWTRLYAQVLCTVADWLRPEAQKSDAIRKRVAQLDRIVELLKRGRSWRVRWIRAPKEQNRRATPIRPGARRSTA